MFDMFLTILFSRVLLAFVYLFLYKYYVDANKTYYELVKAILNYFEFLCRSYIIYIYIYYADCFVIVRLCTLVYY